MKIFNAAGANPVHVDEAAGLHHRRLVSPLVGGPTSVDVGYNTYKAGGLLKGPYAYNRDEFCYIAAGETETSSSGVRVRSSPGTFMWRPRGVKTDYLQVTKDVVNVCAFAPARVDAASHRLTRDQIPEWDGMLGSLPVPQRIHLSMASIVPFPPAPDDSKIVHRIVFSEANGCSVMNVSHTQVPAGTTIPAYRTQRDEVWWLEEGELEIMSETGVLVLKAHECLFLTAGEGWTTLMARAQSAFVTFSPSGAGQ